MMQLASPPSLQVPKVTKIQRRRGASTTSSIPSHTFHSPLRRRPKCDARRLRCNRIRRHSHGNQPCSRLPPSFPSFVAALPILELGSTRIAAKGLFRYLSSQVWFRIVFFLLRRRHDHFAVCFEFYFWCLVRFFIVLLGSFFLLLVGELFREVRILGSI